MSFEKAKELYMRAVERHVRDAGEVLAGVPTPASTSYRDSRGVWVLVNCNGRLARVHPCGNVRLG